MKKLPRFVALCWTAAFCALSPLPALAQMAYIPPDPCGDIYCLSGPAAVFWGMQPQSSGGACQIPTQAGFFAYNDPEYEYEEREAYLEAGVEYECGDPDNQIWIQAIMAVCGYASSYSECGGT